MINEAISTLEQKEDGTSLKTQKELGEKLSKKVSKGKFKLSLTDDQTVDFPDELYYDVVVTNTTGEKETYVKGKIKVLQGYTR